MPLVQGIKVPSIRTLRKYGLTVKDWIEVLERQQGVCAVCLLVPKSGKLCVDHEHVRGFKRMSPKERRAFIRGLLCAHCNHRLVNKYITIVAIEKALRYLKAHDARRNGSV